MKFSHGLWVLCTATGLMLAGCDSDPELCTDTGTAADTTTAADTAVAADSGTTVDAGTAADTTTPADTAVAADSGTTVDAGTAADTTTAADTAVAADSGTAPTTDLCYNDTDHAVDKGPSQSTAQSCGLCCLADGGGPGACSATCMAEGATADQCGKPIDAAAISAPCASCYVNAILCAIDKCVPACLKPESEACQICRVEFCDPAFYACSGIENGCADGDDSNGDGKSDCEDPTCAFSDACK